MIFKIIYFRYIILNQHKYPFEFYFRAYCMKSMELNKFAFIFADYYELVIQHKYLNHANIFIDSDCVHANKRVSIFWIIDLSIHIQYFDAGTKFNTMFEYINLDLSICKIRYILSS